MPVFSRFQFLHLSLSLATLSFSYCLSRACLLTGLRSHSPLCHSARASALSPGHTCIHVSATFVALALGAYSCLFYSLALSLGSSDFRPISTSPRAHASSVSTPPPPPRPHAFQGELILSSTSLSRLVLLPLSFRPLRVNCTQCSSYLVCWLPFCRSTFDFRSSLSLHTSPHFQLSTRPSPFR